MLGNDPVGLRVLLSGATGGIGTAIASRLIQSGCRIGAFDLDFTDWPLAEHRNVIHQKCDISSWEATQDTMEAVAEQLGGCDAVIANAAIVDNIHRASRFLEKDWEHEIRVNLTGAFRFVQSAYPYLRSSPTGRVVLISSAAAAMGQPGQVAYAASKAALLGMVMTLAAEWGSDGISCNAVLPGMVETPKVLALPTPIRHGYVQRTPLGRFAALDEVAGLVSFLLAPSSGYITGQAIRIDGGLGLNYQSLATGSSSSPG
jgi:NAD(P)-dependent dehydrogenase (short-subunit alcohol dehydrogenase family)